MSSSASRTSGCSPRSSKLGGAGSAGSIGSIGSAGPLGSATGTAGVSEVSVPVGPAAPAVAIAAASAVLVATVGSIDWIDSAVIAASSAIPFPYGAVSFVIVKNLGVIKLSEIIQSERWSGRGHVGIHRHETTSSVAAPVVVTDAELARRTRVRGLASSGFGNHLRSDLWEVREP